MAAASISGPTAQVISTAKRLPRNPGRRGGVNEESRTCAAFFFRRQLAVLAPFPARPELERAAFHSGRDVDAVLL